MPILRYAIANVSLEDVAKAGQVSGLSGTISSGIGFGSWGIEPTTILEIATDDVQKADSTVQVILRLYDEESAYRTFNGESPSLLKADGTKEWL